MTAEVKPPKGPYSGKHKVYCQKPRQWEKFCQEMPGPMRVCYIELADSPFPAQPNRRHHRLKGNLKDHWEYEVSGSGRVRYRRGPNNEIVVLITQARHAPPDTH